MTVSQATLVVRPFTKPARSLRKNHCLSFNHPSGSGDLHPKRSPPEISGTVNRPIDCVMVGDCVIVPSFTPTKTSLDKKRVMPGARMLMAMPATIWFTPNVTVASPNSRPPRAPPIPPQTNAAHGPHW